MRRNPFLIALAAVTVVLAVPTIVYYLIGLGQPSSALGAANTDYAFAYARFWALATVIALVGTLVAGALVSRRSRDRQSLQEGERAAQ